MATWDDLVEFVKSGYRVVAETRDELRVIVQFEDERSQVMIIAREVLDGTREWVQIASPIGRAAQINVYDLLIQLGGMAVVGGAVIMGDHVVLRHSLPLADLDAPEFTDPLELLAGTADQLEEQFIRGDDY
ncbi:MAG TPA: hypothetical protein VHW44_26335 [Pseudonocardiaceae bacterium]|jgi:hypothetical protein|nr:hypothetical protein [Pseudonocardiaceae bacterium]